MDENQKKINDLRSNIGKVLVGKEEVIDQILAAMFAGGHVLLEDTPGTGKTTLAKSLAASCDGKFQRIQFTPDLLPADVLGINYYNQKAGDFVFQPGPVFTQILLADEINRATPRTQSALLECMEEHQVTSDGVTRALETPYFVIATQNPVETSGTFPLPEAQLDRFMMKVSVGVPTKELEFDMVRRFEGGSPMEALRPVCTPEDILAIQEACKNVELHDDLLRYMIEIIDATRNEPKVISGVSPRGTITFVRAVKAYAYINGRSYVVPEDVKALAVPVLAHRIVVDLGQRGDEEAAMIVRTILDRTAVPTEDWSR